MGNLSPEKRLWVMSRVKGRDTQSEKLVGSSLHRLGYRFRLQGSDLPGQPDVAPSKFKAVIFEPGRYWPRLDCPNGWTD
ncbi:MAG: hypothetical protein LBT38_09945 [Deltaproteobacteria bacterium]|jgi:DNA mismatch endonuclease (patch repair protein)|nr:hypothetical protein [Deltaproteobacteria bacterium]